jgi:ABC-2 type transport system permease protein
MEMSAKQESPFTSEADTSGLFAFWAQSLAIADAELRKVWRDPTELFSRGAQPLLWLVVFGQVLERIHGIPTGGIRYTAFMAPGIMAQSVLFTAIFYGIGIIWERDLGIIHKLLVSPAYRFSLVFGKAISAGVRGLVQAVLVYIIVAIMRIDLQFDCLSILGVLAAVLEGCALFASFSLVVACIVKTRERFMGIGQLLTMPLFFASNAIYPLALMPHWLRIAARLNPLTYLVDALRGLMVCGGQSVYGLPMDFAVLTFFLVFFLTIAAKLYPGIIR